LKGFFAGCLAVVALGALGGIGACEKPDLGCDHAIQCADGAASDATPDAGGVTAASGCGEHIVTAAGAIDPAEYRRQARLWDRATIDCRLGPRFADLHAGQQTAPRPTAYEPAHKTASMGYLCKTYELGTAGAGCGGNCDFGSTAGQVLYAADDPADPGLDRVQTYGYESGVICESPQAGGWLGGPHPDPVIPKWSGALGRAVRAPNGFAQTEMWETNGGILIFPDGLVGATGNQTAGGSQPYFQLPPGKVPTAVALTSYNEFALVTVWDTDAVKGQLAVFALRADSPAAFSVPYFALPNEAGFVAIHLMGYVDLPDMAAPTAIAASGNNGGTPGGHAIGNEFKTIATDPTARQAFARDDGERWMASSGQAVILSRWQDKVTFLDLRPLFQFVRDAYFTTDAKWIAASAKDAWPHTFDSAPQAKPIVITTLLVPRPTAARVGNQIGAFPKGLQTKLNAFVANADGDVRLFDVSAIDAVPRPVPADAIRETAKVQAGRNITSMTARRPFNRSVLVASRGDAAIAWLDVEENALVVSRQLTDSRFTDPVIVDLNDRGPLVTVGDFTGKKLVSYRVGATENNAGKPPANYGCGPAGGDATCTAAECGGELGFPGAIFFLATSNVN
jgi:hypothetical protein